MLKEITQWKGDLSISMYYKMLDVKHILMLFFLEAFDTFLELIFDPNIWSGLSRFCEGRIIQVLSFPRRSLIVVPDWDCHRLSSARPWRLGEREPRYVLCSSIVEVAGPGPVTEAGDTQMWSVKGLTENKERSVCWRCLTTARTCVGCQGSRDDGAELRWEMKLKHILFYFHFIYNKADIPLPP